ncbi:MAG: glycogen-binding domain-containing protein [Bacteroidota bacterium]|nr:glycogen-binding domain-containing protein [Bacteroidota bacterium]
MKVLIKYILFLSIVFLMAGCRTQYNPNDTCRVENGRIIFQLNLHWNDSQKMEIAHRFDLDSALIARVYKELKNITFNSIEWKVEKINPDLVELSKPVDNNAIPYLNPNDIFMLDESWLKAEGEQERESASYGVNQFNSSHIVSFKDDIATFFLPGQQNVQKIYLAGTFNNWNTMQTAMQKTDSGWVVSVKLLPGKYLYKYIIDGKWSLDPNNILKQKDSQSNVNSVLFRYNYHFDIKGYQNARKAIVAGSFNNWNSNELKMVRTADGWTLPIYLREGTHAYKFIIDDQWMTDPANSVKRPDGKGNSNSFLGIGDSHLFQLKGFTSAKEVVLTGNFNAWNTGELFMEKTTDGWQLPYILAAGNYEYKFIVDGKWITDPDNPFTSGSGDLTNSVLIFKPSYTFTLNKYSNARKIIITGSFSNWNPDGYRMLKKDGTWTFPLYLKPGKYTYKFIVDDQWILDPNNKLWETNEYGTNNSVLWIAP